MRRRGAETGIPYGVPPARRQGARPAGHGLALGDIWLEVSIFARVS
jgi:hypothetical protein